MSDLDLLVLAIAVTLLVVLPSHGGVRRLSRPAGPRPPMPPGPPVTERPTGGKNR